MRAQLSSSPGQPARGESLCKGSQATAIVSVGGAFNCLHLCGIRMDDTADGRQADVCHHGQRNFADHIAGMARDDGGAKDLVRPFLYLDFYKSSLLAVRNGSIDVGHRYEKGPYRDPFFTGFSLVQPHMRNFRVGVGAPRDYKRADFLASEEQSILHHDARGSLGRMSELVRKANVARGM